VKPGVLKQWKQPSFWLQSPFVSILSASALWQTSLALEQAMLS
jgi:hypothetical protein